MWSKSGEKRSGLGVHKGHIKHITVTCSTWERKWTPLWAGVFDALLEELRPAGSVITARELGQVCVR